MKTAAIICEYNPFHNGHAYQIDRIRQMGFDCVASIMSGNLVQRGELAVCDKFTRARMALSCGSDLVAELPSCFALSSAEGFARAGVFIAERLGCDALVFGSECGSAERLSELSEQLSDSRLEPLIRAALKKGLSFSAARYAAFTELFGEAAELKSPNDILGIEYITQIKKLDSSLRPICIQRKGAEHDGQETVGELASASFIRELIVKGELSRAAEFMPSSCGIILKGCISHGHIATPEAIDKAVISKLRGMSARELSSVAGMGDGLEFRLYNALRRASSVNELAELTKTKRHTMARIKRAILSAYFDIDASLGASLPTYVRILGMNQTGQSLISSASSEGVPIALRPSLLKGDPLFELECAITDRYVLSFESPLPCGTELTSGIIKYS